MAQLERIGAMMEQRQSLEGEVRKEESGDDMEGSENGPRESQEKETLLSAFCQYTGFVLFFNRIFFFCELNV